VAKVQSTPRLDLSATKTLNTTPNKDLIYSTTTRATTHDPEIEEVISLIDGHFIGRVMSEKLAKTREKLQLSELKSLNPTAFRVLKSQTTNPRARSSQSKSRSEANLQRAKSPCSSREKALDMIRNYAYEDWRRYET
jgi:ElaB/YqjD/DUF883 family membrane-anchored ribosome-binding protein